MATTDTSARMVTAQEALARGRVYTPGTPIFDAVGLWVGIVDSGLARVRGDELLMRPGWRTRQSIAVPLTTIVRADPDGIYLDTFNTYPEAQV